MKTFTLRLAMACIFSIMVFNAGAQNIVADNMNSAEERENPTDYPALDKQLRFSIEGGYSHRLGKIVDEIPDEYAMKMRTGFNFGAELIYFPTEIWGIGAKYSGRIFNAHMANLEDRLNIHYFAPTAVIRRFDRRHRNAWVFGLSIGYISFREEVVSGGNVYKISQGGLGSSYEIGYDIRMTNRRFLGLKLSLTTGSVTLGDYGSEQKENASSIDLSMGLRF